MPTLYFDNDKTIRIKKAPATSVPTWAVTTDPDAFPPTPVHASMVGDMAYVAARRCHEAVIEGGDITAYLNPDITYSVVIWWNENFRKVIPDVGVALRRS